MRSKKYQDPHWLMRWLMFVVVILAFLASFVIGSVLAYQTKNPIFLGVPVSLLTLMNPIMRYLFPHKKEES